MGIVIRFSALFPTSSSSLINPSYPASIELGCRSFIRAPIPTRFQQASPSLKLHSWDRLESAFLQDNLVLSSGLIMWIGHREEIRKLRFRILALCRSESKNCHNSLIRSKEGLTLATPASESLHGGQFTLSKVNKPNYLAIRFPPTQHYSFL